MIELNFTLSEKQYVRAQELFMRKKQPLLFWQAWISLIVMSVAFTFLVYDFGAGNRAPYWLKMPAAALLVGGIVGLPSHWLRRRAFRKRYKRDLRLFKDQHLLVDSDGMFGEVPGIGSGRTSWAAFDEWLQAPTLIVLVRSGNQICILPVESLATSERTELLKLLALHVHHSQALQGGV